MKPSTKFQKELELLLTEHKWVERTNVPAKTLAWWVAFYLRGLAEMMEKRDEWQREGSE